MQCRIDHIVLNRVHTARGHRYIFATPIDDRYFEDYVTGAVYDCGSLGVEEDEIVAFEIRFDPQPFHTDPETAGKSAFGALIAGGLQNAALHSASGGLPKRPFRDRRYFSSLAGCPGRFNISRRVISATNDPGK